EFAAAQGELSGVIRRLHDLYDCHGVRGGTTAAVDEATVAAFEEVIGATNRCIDAAHLIRDYVHCVAAADASDEEAAVTRARIDAEVGTLAPLVARFDGWVCSLGADRLIQRSAVAAAHAFRLRRAEVAARHQMTEDQEVLAAELGATGAWAQLWEQVTSRLTATVDDAGTSRPLPMSSVQNLAADGSPVVRRAAFQAELSAWE
nr:oligoendopeptidase F [Chloroflexota bacterium]